MKKILILLSIYCFSSKLNAQQPAPEITQPLEQSASITGVALLDVGNPNSFLLLKTHGATIFNQKTTFSLVDQKTLVETDKKIDFPAFTGYKYCQVKIYGDRFYNSAEILEMNTGLGFLYRSLHGSGDQMISVLKVSGSLDVSSKPKYLFTLRDESTITASVSEKRNHCLLTFQKKDKASKTHKLLFHLYDNNFNLLKSDSIVSDYKQPDIVDVVVFDEGFIVARNQGTVKKISVTEVKNQRVSNFELNTGSKEIKVLRGKLIQGNKLILLCKYFQKNEDKSYTNGLIKIAYDLSQKKILENVSFEHVPEGDRENSKREKCVEKSVITDNGECFGMISQNVGAEYSEYNSFKFELMYLNNEKECWKKQLPMAAGVDRNALMFFQNGSLSIAFQDFEPDYSKINYSRYIYEKPFPYFLTESQNPFKYSNISLLTIDKKGTIKHNGYRQQLPRNIALINQQLLIITQSKTGPILDNCMIGKLKIQS